MDFLGFEVIITEKFLIYNYRVQQIKPYFYLYHDRSCYALRSPHDKHTRKSPTCLNKPNFWPRICPCSFGIHLFLCVGFEIYIWSSWPNFIWFVHLPTHTSFTSSEPGRQTHLNEPIVFWQISFSSQLDACDLHSSTS